MDSKKIKNLRSTNNQYSLSFAQWMNFVYYSINHHHHYNKQSISLSFKTFTIYPKIWARFPTHRPEKHLTQQAPSIDRLRTHPQQTWGLDQVWLLLERRESWGLKRRACLLVFGYLSILRGFWPEGGRECTLRAIFLKINSRYWSEGIILA